ncbi:MAG: ATP-dependent Clp protease ATP-binding subunit, partial [Candidatus Thermochlorobacter sp.]
VRDMGISIEFTKAAKDFLVTKGYDQQFGARPLRRALQKYVEDPMAEEILKGKFTEGSSIKIKYSKKNDCLVFIDTSKETADKETDETVEEK